jgi:hypothetical protein
MRRALALSLLLVAGLGLLAACGDDGDGDEDASSDDSTAPEGSAGGCPFDAQQLSDEVGFGVEEATSPEGSPDALTCVFVEAGGSIDDLSAFTIASLGTPGDATLAELNETFATQEGFTELPDLGEDAFVRTQTIPGGAAGTDLQEAVVTYEADGTVQTVVLAGVATPEEMASATAGVVSLLA